MNKNFSIILDKFLGNLDELFPKNILSLLNKEIKVINNKN